MIAFALAMLYPVVGVFTQVGPWQWDGSIPESTAGAVRVSLILSGAALLIDIVIGTPVAWYLAHHSGRDSIIWEAAILVSVLLHLGVMTSNSAPAFVATQVYASIGYYIVAARAALAGVPRNLELMAGLLGLRPLMVFRRITFPLAKLGLAAAVSLAWVRAVGEFGAVIVTSYYPSGMPVQIWINLQDAGMPAVLPLLVIFLLTALPLPWLIHLLANARPADA
jgi:molybdate/tungstate transport system permease protein